MKSIITLLIVAVCLSASARLGETAEEIQTRYGKPILPTQPTVGIYGLSSTNYLFKGYEITVNFKNGKSIRESVKPKAKSELTEAECFELVKNIGGLDWAWVKEAEFFWKRDDGALGIGSKESFAVESQQFANHRTEYFKAKAEAEKAAAQKATSGF